MSTRAVYTFKNNSEWDSSEVHIYKHHDGYPKGGLTWIKEAYQYYRDNEAIKHLQVRDALSTSFLLSINKGEQYGGCEITEHHKAHGDLEYRYEIKAKREFKKIPTALNLDIVIYSTASWEGEEKIIFKGNFAEAVAEFGIFKEVA